MNFENISVVSSAWLKVLTKEWSLYCTTLHCHWERMDLRWKEANTLSKFTVQFYAIGIPDLHVYSHSDHGPKCAADLQPPPPPIIYINALKMNSKEYFYITTWYFKFLVWNPSCCSPCWPETYHTVQAFQLCYDKQNKMAFYLLVYFFEWTSLP